MKNIEAFVKAQLQNKAKETNRPFSEVLQYFGMERFLHRVSPSKYADKFILKGGSPPQCQDQFFNEII